MKTTTCLLFALALVAIAPIAQADKYLFLKISVPHDLPVDASTPLSWPTAIEKSSETYSHSSGDSTIEILETGRYLFGFNLSITADNTLIVPTTNCNLQVAGVNVSGTVRGSYYQSDLYRAPIVVSGLFTIDLLTGVSNDVSLRCTTGATPPHIGSITVLSGSNMWLFKLR